MLNRKVYQYRRPRQNMRESIPGYLFSGISIAGLFLFYVIPLLKSFVQTVVEVDDGIQWKGTELYSNLLINSTFLQAFQNTLLMTVIAIPLLLLFSMCLTYCMNKMVERKTKGTYFWFAVHLIPMILPSAVIATIIKIFFAEYGLVNSLLTKMSLNPIPWLNSSWTFWILVLIFCWKNVGYSMVVLLGGMQGIEKEQKEAAALDGADEFKTFIHIVLPQLSVFFRFVIIMGIVGIFKLYRESYLLLGESPPDEAYMVQNFLNNNFASLNFDRTIAASVLLCLFIGIVLVLLFKLMGDRKNE